MVEHITSRKNPFLQHVKKLLSSRAYREECREFVGDGTKLLEEALRWSAPLTAVILSASVEMPELPISLRTVIVPPDVMSFVSDMGSPQGALFVCRMPQAASLPDTNTFLVLDGLQDPGNVGTILRTADAFSVPVVLSEGCADPFNPKTVRASMGAVLRMQLHFAAQSEIISRCKALSVPIAVTVPADDAKDLRLCRPEGTVVIGSEGNGVCDAFLQAADSRIVIPMSPRCESLNAAAAAAIILWEMCR